MSRKKMFSKFDELEDIVRENTILIKKNRALVSINHDNLHNAYRESYDVTRELLLLQLERARKFIEILYTFLQIWSLERCKGAQVL